MNLMTRIRDLPIWWKEEDNVSSAHAMCALVYTTPPKCFKRKKEKRKKRKKKKRKGKRKL